LPIDTEAGAAFPMRIRSLDQFEVSFGSRRFRVQC